MFSLYYISFAHAENLIKGFPINNVTYGAVYVQSYKVIKPMIDNRIISLPCNYSRNFIF